MDEESRRGGARRRADPIHLTFSFALEERKGETLLMFSQDYARELSNEIYGTYNYNWGYYVNSLKIFCEKGAGVPFTPA